MGLDTRSYTIATPEWREAWVERVNEQGWRLTTFGLMREMIGKRNYGLTGGYLSGRAPFTLEEAPLYHQDDLEGLPWPGGLVGGMISSNGSGPSFRGKVYEEYVIAATGESLYAACEDYWQGDKLRTITEQLEAALTINGYTGIEPDERKALAAWFRVCVTYNLAVAGDY